MTRRTLHFLPLLPRPRGLLVMTEEERRQRFRRAAQAWLLSLETWRRWQEYLQVHNHPGENGNQ